jgi:hypothetical protein
MLRQRCIQTWGFVGEEAGADFLRGRHDRVRSACRLMLTELLCTSATIAVDLVAVVTAGGQLV